jgi:C-terminal processing protease CtpA/Prc
MNHGRFSTQMHDSLTLEFLEGDTVALLTIPTLGDTALNAKFRDSFAEIRRRGSTSLILDLRDNSGGIDEFNTSLLDYLIARPYRFYRGFTFVARDKEQLRHAEHKPRDFMGDEDADRLTPEEWEVAYRTRSLPELIERVNATNRATGVHGPAKENGFTGQVYVLVNGGSASSAAEVPALLHFLGVGTIVGEEVNGGYQGVTAGILLRLVLPHSKIRTIVPLIAYHNAVLPGTFEGRGVHPHFDVPQTIDDSLAGKDSALEFTLQLIRARRAP